MSQTRFPYARLLTTLCAVAVALGVASAPADATTIASSGLPAPQLATADVAAAWQFPVPNWNHSNKEQGRVDDIAEVGGVAYIGGNFTQTSDHSGHTVARSYLAAESIATGALSAWAPSLNGRVYALATSPDNSLLYVGGAFTQVNGQSYPHLVAFNIATGQISPALPPTAINGTVKAIAQAGSDLYIGGSFSTSVGNRISAWPSSAPTAAPVGGQLELECLGHDEVRDLIGDRPAVG